jgi:hypothetical protein
MRTMDGGGLWLNRDEHLVFTVRVSGPPGARSADLWRISEDDAGQLCRAGSGTVGSHEFRVSPVFLPVYHFIHVEQVALDDAGEVMPGAPRSRKAALAEVWHNLRMTRTGALYAGPDEIRELITQVQAAEPVAPAALGVDGPRPLMAQMQDLAAKVLRDLAGNPAGEEKLAAEEAARADPWCWYCRLCGARGSEPGREARDTAARAHLGETPCGRHAVTGWAEAGHLLHVWTWPRSAAAQHN